MALILFQSLRCLESFPKIKLQHGIDKMMEIWRRARIIEFRGWSWKRGFFPSDCIIVQIEIGEKHFESRRKFGYDTSYNLISAKTSLLLWTIAGVSSSGARLPADPFDSFVVAARLDVPCVVSPKSAIFQRQLRCENRIRESETWKMWQVTIARLQISVKLPERVEKI